MFKKFLNRFYKFLVFIVLILNLILFTRVLGYIYLPGELTSMEKSQQAAKSVINYSEDLAESYGVIEASSVKDVMARFKYEVEKADNPEELASLIIDYGRQTQDIIFREVQEMRIDMIFEIINDQDLPDAGKITLSRMDDQVEFFDPDNILTEKTREKICEISFNQTLEIEIEEQHAQLASTGDIFNQVNYLQTKVASLERQLKLISQRAGYEPLSGSGVVIEVMDGNNSSEETSIVHDNDLRSIINELLIAGAAGIEVGGQRLTARSAVRCVGPTILVNNKPIPVNPVVIKAVGDPDVLASSLDIIKSQLGSFGIEITLTKKEVWLKGQSNYEG